LLAVFYPIKEEAAPTINAQSAIRIRQFIASSDMDEAR
jgi:hypothetical protein